MFRIVPDHKKQDDLTSVGTADGTTLSLSASERREGHVVTSIVTTYVLITLPCGASELPSSLTHYPVTSATSKSFNTTRGSKSSITQAWNTTVVNTGSSSSFTNWNITSGKSDISTGNFHGTTTAITVSNWNSSTPRPSISSTLSNGTTAILFAGKSADQREQRTLHFFPAGIFVRRWYRPDLSCHHIPWSRHNLKRQYSVGRKFFRQD
ncbi:hypothetical protein ColTof4_08771 [Colletotrichum tofieldiae]|nr:hypothetical protein ColTof4_08771 [Colletotrichum tofieldiae]